MINTIPDFDSFFNGLSATLAFTKQYKKANNEEFAFLFNPIINFYKPGENGVTDILAFFLSTQQSHGQNRLFLDLFLSECQLDKKVGAYEKVRVIREKATHAGRKIDLLVEFDNGFAVAVENKIWAKDQNQQLSHYCQWLNETYRGNYSLIYLTPYGAKPSELSITREQADQLMSEGRLRTLDYSTNMISIVTLWLERCKADKVRNFLKDFTQFLHHTVNENIFMEDQSMIVDYVVADERRLATALAVTSAINGVYDALLLELKLQLEQIAEKHNLVQFEFNLNRGQQWTGFSFYFPEERKSNYSVRFEWEGKNLTYGYWGFVYKGKPDKSLIPYFNSHFGKAEKHTDGWPWYKLWDDYRHFHPQTYLDIKNGTFTKAVESLLVEILTITSNYPVGVPEGTEPSV